MTSHIYAIARPWVLSLIDSKVNHASLTMFNTQDFEHYCCCLSLLKLSKLQIILEFVIHGGERFMTIESCLNFWQMKMM